MFYSEISDQQQRQQQKNKKQQVKRGKKTLTINNQKDNEGKKIKLYTFDDLVDDVNKKYYVF